MKIISLLFCAILFYSCSSDASDGKVLLFDEIYMQVEANETIAELNKQNTDLYFSYIDNPDLQAPLFKYIKSEKYDLFIGLPVGTTFAEIKQSFKKDGILTGKLENSPTPFVYVNYSDNGKNITKYLVDLDNNLVFLILVSDTETIIPQAEQEAISHRLSKE